MELNKCRASWSCFEEHVRIALIRMQMAQRRGQIYEFMCKCSKKFGTRTLEKLQSRAVCVADSKFLCYCRRRANELLRRAAAAATTAHSHSLPSHRILSSPPPRYALPSTAAKHAMENCISNYRISRRRVVHKEQRCRA